MAAEFFDADKDFYEKAFMQGNGSVHGLQGPKVASKLDVGKANVRAFDSGATRDLDTDKNDYEGFLSPLALEAYGDYMRSHQTQSDGSVRTSDNWQKGIPKSAYVKSLLRHVLVVWKIHRGYSVRAEKVGGVMVVPTLRDALCAVLFNAFGLLHEIVKERGEQDARKKPILVSGLYCTRENPCPPCRALRQDLINRNRR